MRYALICSKSERMGLEYLPVIAVERIRIRYSKGVYSLKALIHSTHLSTFARLWYLLMRVLRLALWLSN